MEHKSRSIRPFIGAQDFDVSRNFYRDLGFEESILSTSMSYFENASGHGFYLQRAYVADWVDNSMIFMGVDDVGRFWSELTRLGLEEKYENVRLTPIKTLDWGRECFVHDPSGILWHFGEFSN